MAKTTLCSLLLLLLLFSCYKAKVPRKPIKVGTIQADINGISTSFNIGATADTATSFFDYYNKSFILSVNGLQDATQYPAKINIWFMKVPADNIGVGAYPDLTSQTYVYIDYKTMWKDTMYDYTADGFDPYICKAIITSIDSTVQGTFSGNVIIGVGSYGVQQPPLSYAFINGRFNVAIHK